MHPRARRPAVPLSESCCGAVSSPCSRSLHGTSVQSVTPRASGLGDHKRRGERPGHCHRWRGAAAGSAAPAGGASVLALSRKFMRPLLRRPSVARRIPPPRTPHPAARALLTLDDHRPALSSTAVLSILPGQRAPCTPRAPAAHKRREAVCGDHHQPQRSSFQEAQVRLHDTGQVLGDAGSRLESLFADALLKELHFLEDMLGRRTASPEAAPRLLRVSPGHAYDNHPRSSLFPCTARSRFPAHGRPWFGLFG